MRTRSYKRTLKPQVPAEKAPAHSSHPLSSSESVRAPRWSPRYLQHQHMWLWLDNDSYVKAGAFSRMFSHATESARPSLRTTYRKTKGTSCSRRQQLTYATVKSKIQTSKLSTSSFKQNISKRGKLWRKRQKLYNFKFLQNFLAQSLKVITFSSCTSQWPGAGQEINCLGLGSFFHLLLRVGASHFQLKSHSAKGPTAHEWNTQTGKKKKKTTAENDLK